MQKGRGQDGRAVRGCAHPRKYRYVVGSHRTIPTDSKSEISFIPRTTNNILTTFPQHAVGVGGVVGDATKLDLSGWDRDFRINVTSMVLMSRHAIPAMRKSGRGGAIVNMSSVSGMMGGNPSLLYATSKGAIIQMTRAMAVHHGKEGIRVNCVAPGMVYTPMVRTRGGGMTGEMRQARIEQNLLGTEGTAWDVGYGEL